MIDENRKKALVVISLGAGVQSSTMALMAASGELPRPVVRFLQIRVMNLKQ